MVGDEEQYGCELGERLAVEEEQLDEAKVFEEDDERDDKQEEVGEGLAKLLHVWMIIIFVFLKLSRNISYHEMIIYID